MGVPIFVGYFAYFNSKPGKGQTLGKRLMKIRVLSTDGELVSTSKSILRAAVLAVPFVVSGLNYSPSMLYRVPVVSLLNLLFYGILGALIYLVLFNGPTRRSLHDLITGTMVVRAGETMPMGLPSLGSLHRNVLIGWAVVLAILPFAWFFMAGSRGNIEKLVKRNKEITQTINREKSLWGARVSINKVNPLAGNGGGMTIKVLVNFTGPGNLQEGAMDRTAATLFKKFPDSRQADLVTVTVVRGYNLGFCFSRTTKSMTMRPDEWLSRIR